MTTRAPRTPRARGSRFVLSCGPKAMNRTALALPKSLDDALRFAPVRPAIASGVRAAVATVLPMALAGPLGIPDLAYAGLAGFVTTLVDKGGAYRSRAAVMSGVLIAAPVGAFVASLVSTRIEVSVAFAALAAMLLAYLRAYGVAASSASSSVLVLIFVSLARPAPSLLAALDRGAFTFVGALWAMALGLLLWPVRYYRPARLSVVRAVRAVQAYTRDVQGLAEALNDTHAVARRIDRAAIRPAMEDARATLAATRRGRREESGRGERLLVVLESLDQLFANVLALAESLETTRGGARWPAADRTIAACLQDLTGFFEELAKAVAEEAHVEVPKIPAWDFTALTPGISVRPPPVSARGERTSFPPANPAGSLTDGELREAEYGLAAELLTRARAYADAAREEASTLATERGTPRTLSAEKRRRGSLLAPLRDNFTLHSEVLRHALRLGVTLGVAVAITEGFKLPRGYWVTLTAAATLQPQMPATFLKATQRVLGTLAGGLLAALITSVVHDPRALLAMVFVLSVISIAVLPINYALYATFLTPAFVLIAELSAHTPGLVRTRFVNTLLGGALALLASRVLWRTSERGFFPNAAAAALRAERVYFLDAVAKAGGGLEHLEGRRREVGLAIINADASLQRWIAESRRTPSMLEAPIALIVYVRAFVAGVAALASARALTGIDVTPFAEVVDGVLIDLEGATRLGRAPAELPSLGRALARVIDADPPESGRSVGRKRALMRARLTRLAEQVAVQHELVGRWSQARPEGHEGL